VRCSGRVLPLQQGAAAGQGADGTQILQEALGEAAQGVQPAVKDAAVFAARYGHHGNAEERPRPAFSQTVGRPLLPFHDHDILQPCRPAPQGTDSGEGTGVHVGQSEELKLHFPLRGLHFGDLN